MLCPAFTYRLSKLARWNGGESTRVWENSQWMYANDKSYQGWLESFIIPFDQKVVVLSVISKLFHSISIIDPNRIIFKRYLQLATSKNFSYHKCLRHFRIGLHLRKSVFRFIRMFPNGDSTRKGGMANEVERVFWRRLIKIFETIVDDRYYYYYFQI